MVSYNHEGFILKSVESVMMQKTNFKFKLFIGEDCSTDRTRELCKDLHKKYPDKIELVLHENNIGAVKNAFQIYDKCYQSGAEYVALLEGDDFWTDPNKLQMQVDFLDQNPDYEVCFTNINIINDQGVISKDQLIPSSRRKTAEHKDLPIWAPTLTRMFKNRDFKEIMNTVLGFDAYMLLYQSKFGKIRFIDKITGTYRVHEGGIYSSKSEAKRKEVALLISIESLKLIDKSLFIKYFGLIFKKMMELKKLDIELFNKNKKTVYNSYKEYHNNFSFYKKMKVRIGFVLLAFPFSNQNNTINTFIIKLLNKLFVY